MASFCSIFNIPPPSTSKSWSEHNRTTHSAAVELPHECKETGKQLRELFKSEDEDEDNGNDSVLDIMVSYDGTWHHRGFKAAHGVGVVMSVDTGEILDAIPLSKECVECRRMQNVDPESDDCMIWEYFHFEGGFCKNNYDGPMFWHGAKCS